SGGAASGDERGERRGAASRARRPQFFQALHFPCAGRRAPPRRGNRRRRRSTREEPDTGAPLWPVARSAQPVARSASALFASKPDRPRRTILRRPAKPDEAFTLDLHAVAADKGLLAARTLHEGAVRTLVDQHELAPAHLDAR